MHTCVWVKIYVCAYALVHVCMCVCVCIYTLSFSESVCIANEQISARFAGIFSCHDLFNGDMSHSWSHTPSPPFLLFTHTRHNRHTTRINAHCARTRISKVGGATACSLRIATRHAPPQEVRAIRTRELTQHVLRATMCMYVS